MNPTARLAWIMAYAAKASVPTKALEFANRAYDDYVAKWGDDERVALPVFRLRNGAEHFYTISADERDSAVSQYGYIYEGIAFYAFLEP